MSCDDVLHLLASGATPSRAAREHAAACEACRRLLEADEALRAEPRAAPRMSPALRGALAAHERAAAPYTPSRRALAPAGGLVAALGVVALLARRPDFARVPPWLVLVSALGFLGAFAAGLALVLVRDRAGRGARDGARAGFLAAVAIAYAALTTVAVESVPDPPATRAVQAWLAANAVPVVGAWVRHLPCTMVGCLIAAGLAALVVRAAARTALGSPRLAGAVCGAAAAMGTAFVLFAYCPSHAAFHVVLVHAIPLLATVALAARFGRRALAP